MNRSYLRIACAASPGPNAAVTGAPSTGTAALCQVSPAPTQIPSDGRVAGSSARSSPDLVCCQMMFFTSLSPYDISFILLFIWKGRMITSFQMRAARALLGIDQRTLAELIGEHARSDDGGRGVRLKEPGPPRRI